MSKRLTLSFLVGMTLLPFATKAAVFKVLDANGEPVKNMVITIDNTNASAGLQATNAIMVQRERKFDPHILVVQQGASVSFPNEDDIAHQVYSFSDAKAFQMRIYKDEEQAPVVFEKPGVIELGCNVHDWMLAYIYVADTPFFAITDDNGQATIDINVNEEQSVNIWHPLLDKSEPTSRKMQLNDNLTITLNSELNEEDSFDLDDLGSY